MACGVHWKLCPVLYAMWLSLDTCRGQSIFVTHCKGTLAQNEPINIRLIAQEHGGKLPLQGLPTVSPGRQLSSGGEKSTLLALSRKHP